MYKKRKEIKTWMEGRRRERERVMKKEIRCVMYIYEVPVKNVNIM